MEYPERKRVVAHVPGEDEHGVLIGFTSCGKYGVIELDNGRFARIDICLIELTGKGRR